jgi:glycosyltransferase involved in cell wall biosynthesis
MSSPGQGQPLRIGLVTPAWPGSAAANGIASATAHLAQGLQELGHRVTVLTHHIDGPHDHPSVVELPSPRITLADRLTFRLATDRGVRAVMIRRLIAGAQRAIAEHGIEILMMEESFGWAGALRAALPIPVVVTLHGPFWLHRAGPQRPRRGPDARRENWEQAGLQRIDAVISPAHDVLDRTRDEWGLPAVPTAVIGNPVRLETTGAPAAALPVPELLFVGRFDRIKGADILLAAFARIAAAHPSCRLTFVGPDPGVFRGDRPPLRLAEALAALPATIRARVTVLGQRSREEIADLRRQAPITIVASRYETFGVALIEAMAAGSAVVSTRVGGCGEILRDGETGLLVPPEDPDALAGACLRLLADPALALRLGTAARADVVARFAPTVIAREVAEFLAPICRGKEIRSPACAADGPDGGRSPVAEHSA